MGAMCLGTPLPKTRTCCVSGPYFAHVDDLDNDYGFAIVDAVVEVADAAWLDQVLEYHF